MSLAIRPRLAIALPPDSRWTMRSMPVTIGGASRAKARVPDTFCTSLPIGPSLRMAAHVNPGGRGRGNPGLGLASMSDAADTASASDPLPGDPFATGGHVVVGVDDSDHGLVALRGALREAALRQATVEAVHVWQPPVAALPFGANVPLSAAEG